ncbi:MAG: AMP-binding protein [Deltaproteobacteria bacterium]|nr:AMP-binding protein [Deltaproteobacteria bacterium]
MATLSPTEIYNGRRVFLLGGTGFLGKVTLAMLLHRFPGVGRVYTMCRAGSGTDSEARFWADVVGSPVFDVLRERYGGALEGFLRDKVRVVGGDVTLDNLGYTDEQAQAIADDVDVILNSSGKVTFNPALDQSLRTNVHGTKNLLAFAKRMKRPALVHVSTCFVAGNRSGEVWEDEEVLGYFPRQKELEGARFSVEQELADCARLSERVREEADDAVQAAQFLVAARLRLREEGRDPDNERYVKLAQARERKNWIRDRLTQLGVERAQRWGWPNIYCYTKAMGDQLVVAETGIVRSIVRPAIVESAVHFPLAGWNEGFTTTAPLIFLALKGQNLFPSSDKLILDLIPVDYVASTLLLVGAQACVEQPKLVHQLCSGDDNPIRMRRVVTLLGLHKRQRYQEKESGNRVVNELMARMEAQPVSLERFDRTSLPMFNRLAKKAGETLDRLRPRWGGGHVVDLVDRLKEKVDRAEEVTRSMQDAFDMYRPFTVENHYIFRADNVRALHGRVPAEERALLPWGVHELDWYAYWMEVHFPGLHKWVFPELEKDFAAKPKSTYTYNHLLELFETSTKLHRHRVALRMLRDGHRDQYTYEELHELATRVAGFLAEGGVAPSDRVLLLSENRPEWAMAYFGVIKAGATCVPIDKESTRDEIVNLTRSAAARGILISDALLEKHAGLEAALRGAGLESQLWTFSQAFALPLLEEETARKSRLPDRVASDAVASLIFTSGTSGHPKGVMLTHKNFTYMVSELSSVFDFTPNDGSLSVLPLHHTFEFSAGLLMPLASGAAITYLPELTGEAITSALKEGHTTAIVGVPALWELLQRRIRNRLGERSVVLEQAAELVMRANSWLWDKSGLNLGRIVFYPIHRLFGGRIRYLISGGSALADDVKRAFHGLGLQLLEGYGLTEASPVLTVARPSHRLIAGSVGQPLPHVEVRILEPDERGVGEVVARGHNVMAGYFQNQEATRATIREGWLHTGDLGHLDEEKNLYIVGRSKEVIVDSNGKNVYPDELEELYASPWVKELSVVGLPDGTAERVAALVVPDYEHDGALEKEEVRERVREHVRSVSAGLPFFKRIKVVQLSDRELPRTATKKVKRREVVAELQRLHKHGETDGAREGGGEAEHDWLLDIVAQVSGRPRGRIALPTRLDELGFDSLMYTELGVALEAAGATVRGVDDLTGIATVRELAGVAQRTRPSRAPVDETEASVAVERDELQIPEVVASVGRKVLGAGQRWLYERLLETSFDGQAHIPAHCNFILAPNHCSHLDIGLAKFAIGEAGDSLCALAASDYFFDQRYKRAYFENFTNLVPMDRSGSLRKSLKRALQLVEHGYNLLIFPEGTRSPTGELGEFKASLGYLALHGKVGILPMHIWGTFDVFPKGAVWLKGRKVGATIAQFMPHEGLEELVSGLPKSEGYRLVAAATQRLVERARDGRNATFVPSALRALWDGERLGPDGGLA